VKKKEYEKLTQENIQHVQELLSRENPITKKEACGILNIAYNTTRLNKILDEYNERNAYRAQRKAQLKGKRATKEEIKDAIQSYLRGDSVSEIAQGLYRSSGFVKGILDRVGVPTRPAAVEDRKGYAFLPDKCVSQEFSSGETVWSAFYHAPAVVEKEAHEMDYVKKYSSKCYYIYVWENTEELVRGGYYAASLACDLGKLTHLEEYGINLEKI
jgi:transposase